MLFYVYILRCNDGKHYVGYTKNFTARLIRHQKGEVHFTRSRLPAEVRSVIAIPDKYIALRLERYFKSGSGRAFAKKHLLE